MAKTHKSGYTLLKEKYAALEAKMETVANELIHAKKQRDDEGKVKTKARKKGYHTGAHGSGSAKHKAEIRQRVKKRASQKKR